MLALQETRPIHTLKNWDKNPRGIKKDDFERLKRLIQKHGQIKPLVITPDGTVLGGNMRLRAYRELGINDVLVSVVDPKNKTEMVAIALADNDRAGYYEEDALAEVTIDLPELDLGDFHIDLGQKPLEDIVEKYGPGEAPTPPMEKGRPNRITVHFETIEDAQAGLAIIQEALMHAHINGTQLKIG